ncbi:MAG: DUF6702 family protein [Vicinamibacterales bacterium]
MRGVIPAGVRVAPGRRRARVARPWAAVLAAALALGLPTGAAAHKFYMSLTVADHNVAGRSLEFTLRLFADDLETAVAKAGRPLKHGQPGFEDAVLAYVRQALVVKRADGSPVALSWVGLENKVDVTWVYVEGKDVASTTGLTVRDALFQDVFQEQVNMLHLNDARGRRVLDFRAGDGFKPF